MDTILSMSRPRTRPGRRPKLGEDLRRARAALGLNQEQAARELAVTRVALARWETGTRTPSGPARLYIEAWIVKALADGGC